MKLRTLAGLVAVALVMAPAAAWADEWDAGAAPADGGTPELVGVRPWVPFQGHLAFDDMFVGRVRARGVEAYVGGSRGLAEFRAQRVGSGFFVGYGGHAWFGATQSEYCRAGEFCNGRWWVGPSVRIGRAWAVAKSAENPTLPDGYAYLELVAFGGRTGVESAPLAPGQTYFERGLRLALGGNLVGWTRFAAGGLVEGGVDVGSGGDLYVVIAWLALALTNHFEVKVEWQDGIAGRSLRGGFAIGSGF